MVVVFMAVDDMGILLKVSFRAVFKRSLAASGVRKVSKMTVLSPISMRPALQLAYPCSDAIAA